MKQLTRDRFPITVKKGHAMVKIYQLNNRYNVNYCVISISATGRRRRTFADLDLARREAGIIAQSLSDGDMEALKLTGQQKQIYVEAERAIAGTGLPLHSVAHEFARCFDILGHAGIVEACRYFKKHVETGLPDMPVATAVEKFSDAKRAEGMGALYLHDIKTILRRFARHFQHNIASIATEDLRDYLNAMTVAPVAKNKQRRLIVRLLNLCKKD